MVRNSGKKEFEEFKESQEFKNRSRESGARSQEDLGCDTFLAPRRVFLKKSHSVLFSVRASWILAPDSRLLFLNSSNSFFLLLAEDAGS